MTEEKWGEFLAEILKKRPNGQSIHRFNVFDVPEEEIDSVREF